MKICKMKNSNALYFSGIFALFIGWVMSYIFYALVIAIPLYLAGVILISLSNKSLSTIIITCSIPLALWYLMYLNKVFDNII